MPRDSLAKVKSQFFDRKAVIDALGRATAGAMSKAGSYLRQRARSSMRRRKRPALPGQSPSAHAGKLKDLLFFSYDPRAQTTVVGPEPFQSTKTIPDGATGAHLMEFGGTAQQRTRAGTRRLAYAPHPFMLPALQAEVQEGNIPSHWANSVKA